MGSKWKTAQIWRFKENPGPDDTDTEADLLCSVGITQVLTFVFLFTTDINAKQ